jgi:hypothetical protein
VGDIFREIEEELKQEDYLRLWKRHGNKILVGVAIVLLVVGGFYGWRQYQAQKRLEASDRYAQAQTLAATDKREDAAALFSQLAEQYSGGYHMLAELQRASLRAQSGDEAGAIAIYDSIAADTGALRETRELATILSVLHALDTPQADRAALDAKLAPLDTPDGPWRHSARELRALLAQKAGDTARAKELYTQLSDDLQAPEGIRARAAEMLAALGG